MWQFMAGIFLGTAGGVAIMCILIAGAEADKSGTVEREEQKDEEKNVK